ncbi:MAG: hypothetical protein H6729_12365 [Deltaproteobacteria bacterium]|nr:hypothetical protein [Deltaproteobacteria bacterium]
MREDLCGLTLDGLTRLSNVDLIKRAERDFEAGRAPTVEAHDDGTVEARFKDGALVRLPRGTPLKRCFCSCGAATVCRHRVQAVLAYQDAFCEAARDVDSDGWDPSRFSDEALADFCGESTVARARAALETHLFATTHPTGIPSVSLPAATVQFLVAGHLAFATCDCAEKHGCEHVVLAVWAFRACRTGGVVDLGLKANAEMTQAMDVVERTMESIAERGLHDFAISSALCTARAEADRAGFVWVADALEDLERQKDAYERRSALFDSEACASLVGEIVARIRASRHTSALPPRWLLGADEVRETVMDQVSLVPLGARLEADVDRRIASVYWVDAKSKNVLVLTKTWDGEREGAVANPKGEALGRLFLTARHSVADLAKSGLVVRAAKRRANGLIDLSLARGLKTTVLAAADAWTDVPEPILIRDIKAHEARVRGLPPRILRPRRIGEDIHVLEVGDVVDVTYKRGTQELVGIVTDAAALGQVRVRSAYRSVSPGAVGAVRSALVARPRFVSGRLRRTRVGWEMSPIAIVGKNWIVPDLAKDEFDPANGLNEEGELNEDGELNDMDERSTSAVLDGRLHAFAALVDQAFHKGRASVRGEIEQVADVLRMAGMERIGVVVARLLSEDRRDVLSAAVVRALMYDPSVCPVR